MRSGIANVGRTVAASLQDLHQVPGGLVEAVVPCLEHSWERTRPIMQTPAALGLQGAARFRCASSKTFNSSSRRPQAPPAAPRRKPAWRSPNRPVPPPPDITAAPESSPGVEVAQGSGSHHVQFGHDGLIGDLDPPLASTSQQGPISSRALYVAMHVSCSCGPGPGPVAWMDRGPLWADIAEQPPSLRSEGAQKRRHVGEIEALAGPGPPHLAALPWPTAKKLVRRLGQACQGPISSLFMWILLSDGATSARKSATRPLQAWKKR